MRRPIAVSIFGLLLVLLLMFFWQPLGQWLTTQIGGAGVGLSIVILLTLAVLVVFWARNRF
jgi:hypothetical protein